MSIPEKWSVVFALQGGKNPFTNQDAAADKLFLGVKDEVWQKQTYVIFYNLLDNFEKWV